MDFKNIAVKSHNLTNNQIVTVMEIKTVGDKKEKILAYFFSSYGDTICKIDVMNNIIYVHKCWKRSVTTAKWFNKFLSDVLNEKINFEEQKEIEVKSNIFTVIMLDE